MVWNDKLIKLRTHSKISFLVKNIVNIEKYSIRVVL